MLGALLYYRYYFIDSSQFHPVATFITSALWMEKMKPRELEKIARYYCGSLSPKRVFLLPMPPDTLHVSGPLWLMFNQTKYGTSDVTWLPGLVYKWPYRFFSVHWEYLPLSSPSLHPVTCKKPRDSMGGPCECALVDSPS